MRTIVAGFCALIAMALPAQAGIVAGAFEGHGPCFGRQYDARHLGKHPEQRVSAVYLSDTAFPDPGFDGKVLEFGFVTRDGEHYSANAYCADNDRCSLEGDGGTFSVVDTAEGLKLTVGDFLGVEGDNGWSGDLTESDDKVFIVYPEAPSACQF